MTPMTSPARAAHRAEPESLEARFAARVTARLDAGVAQTPAPIVARLRHARQRAVALARVQRHMSPVVAPAAAGIGAGMSVPCPPRWQRWGAWIPVLALLAGVWAIAQHQQQARLRAAAEIDARLLTDVLPPAAYTDPGFQEFLRQGGQR